MLKDWEQTTDIGDNDGERINNYYVVFENKNRERVYVYGLTAGRIDNDKRGNKSNIKIVFDAGGNNLKNKQFNSKSQALSYINKYMRTH